MLIFQMKPILLGLVVLFVSHNTFANVGFYADCVHTSGRTSWITLFARIVPNIAGIALTNLGSSARTMFAVGAYR